MGCVLGTEEEQESCLQHALYEIMDGCTIGKEYDTLHCMVAYPFTTFKIS